MSAPEPWDEFELIDRLFRPLAEGAPEALDLRDDAAAIPSRPDHGGACDELDHDRRPPYPAVAG